MAKLNEIKRTQNTKAIEDAGIEFWSCKNGWQLIVEVPRGQLNFWPSTERWRNPDTGETVCGTADFIAYVKEQLR